MHCIKPLRRNNLIVRVTLVLNAAIQVKSRQRVEFRLTSYRKTAHVSRLELVLPILCRPEKHSQRHTCIELTNNTSAYTVNLCRAAVDKQLYTMTRVNREIYRSIYFLYAFLSLKQIMDQLLFFRSRFFRTNNKQ